MMTGYVRSKGLVLSGNQVSKSLRRANPVNHSRRTEDTVRRQNPVPYYAPYFGNKLHCDQNEKLAMYGCTFFAMSDGCSSKIVKLFSMPKKNAVIIYSHFRLVLLLCKQTNLLSFFCIGFTILLALMTLVQYY